MIGKLRALLSNPAAGTVLAVMAVTWGIGKLQSLAGQLQDELVDLDALVARRRGELFEILAEKGRAMGAEEGPAYPAREDVDPLDRVEVASAQ